MKIVHVGFSHGADDSRIYYKECITLAEAGHDVYYVTSDRYKLSSEAQNENPKIILIPLRKTAKLRYFSFLPAVKKVLLTLNADVYHIHEYLLLPLVPFLKRKGYHVIYDMHEMVAEQSFGKYEKKIGTKLANLIRKVIYKYEIRRLRQVDFTIVVTPYQLDYVKKHTSKIAVVANYPEINKTYDPPQFSKKSICFTGGIIKQYHHVEILKALEKCPNVTYELAGLAHESYLSVLKTYPAWERVNFHGFVSRDQALAIQQSSRAGMAIHSSSQVPKSGSFGSLKNFEYLASGIPIICTDYTLWRKIINKWDCGIYVDPKNVSEIAEAINKLTSDRKLCALMGANGRIAAEQVFNWESQGRILLKTYELIEQKNSNPVVLIDIGI